jgi:hypothetical protein
MVAESFQRFGHESPVAVMVRATMENAFAGPALDALFAQTAEQQYPRTPEVRTHILTEPPS